MWTVAALQANRKQRARMHRTARAKATAANQAWSLDFAADQLSNGQRFRALIIVNVCTREAIAVDVGQRLDGPDPVRVLQDCAIVVAELNPEGWIPT